MGFFSFLRRNKDNGRPVKIVDVLEVKAKSKKDYHKKERITIRLAAHTKQGIKTYCIDNKTNVSELTELFYATLLFSKQTKKLKKLINQAA